MFLVALQDASLAIFSGFFSTLIRPQSALTMRTASLLLTLALGAHCLELTPDNWAEKTKDKQARAGAPGKRGYAGARAQ